MENVEPTELKLSYFISSRLRKGKTNKNSVSKPIINIAVFSIVLGIVMMLIALATGFGLQKEIKHKVSALRGHLSIAPYENNYSSVSVSPFSIQLLENIQDGLTSEVQAIYPVIYKGALLKHNNEFEGILFKGIDSLFPWQQMTSFLMKGTFPAPHKVLKKNEIVLSTEIANKLYLSVGDKVKAIFENTNGKIPFTRTFKVIGLYESGFNEYDSQIGYINLSVIQRLNQWQPNEVGSIEISLSRFEAIQNQFQELYYRLPPEIDLLSINELYPDIFGWISLFDFNILVIIVIMCLVAILNMSTALLVLILEGTRLTAILKSLGATNTLIQKIFLWNAAHIYIKGILLGNLLGLALLYSLKKWKWIELDPKLYYVKHVPVEIDFLQILFLNAIVLGASLLFLIIPTLLIRKMDIVSLLRVKK